MTHPDQPSHSSGKDAPPEHEDETIHLTDETTSAATDDLFDLNELAEHTQSYESSSLQDSEDDVSDVIDLTDVIDNDLPSDFSISEDDILDLNLESEPSAGSLLLEPKRIDDFAESLGLKLDPAVSEAPATDAGSSSPGETSPMDDLQKLIDEVVHDSQAPPEDFSGVLPESDRSVNIEPDVSNINPELISREQVDAAIERVIRTLFAEKISHILDEVVTMTVTQEIENLKSILMNHLMKSLH
jgi:hypothetical protein